ncbi:MAG: conjugative transposon protein TraJ, partial [Flavisolibacter sp.]|nr:conjugative transposon protein TraJ [Flavisolibacter sp.]
TGDTFFSTADTAYLIFMIIGIIGYFTVPSVANYIVHAGGGNALLYKVNSVFSSATSSSVQTVTEGSTSMIKDAYGDAAGVMRNSMTTGGSTRGYFKDKISGKV